MSDIILYKKREDCCGCGACSHVCPKAAITMAEDEYGFLYPDIDYDKCIKCGLCQGICGFNIQVTKNDQK